MEKAAIDFREIALSEFNDWCKIKKIDPSNENLIGYLMERNIVTTLTVKRFVIIAKYPYSLSENLNIKRTAVWDLEQKYGIPESTIRLIVKRFQKFFRSPNLFLK